MFDIYRGVEQEVVHLKSALKKSQPNITEMKQKVGENFLLGSCIAHTVWWLHTVS